MSSQIIGPGLFFDSWDLWRHYGEGIRLPPSSSRFEHNFTGLRISGMRNRYFKKRGLIKFMPNSCTPFYKIKHLVKRGCMIGEKI